MKDIISKTVDFVKQTLQNAESGHDWFHIERVWKLSKIIAKTEDCNVFIVEMAALLHDIADPKFHQGNEALAPIIARNFLSQCGVVSIDIESIVKIIQFVSFKNRNDTLENHSVELKIVQDADRLDAIGAIGIARTFNFGGYKNNLMHHPEIPPQVGMSKEEYKKSNGTTINHFYEKLLLLKEMMNTDKGRELAEERHQFMLVFLDQFKKEWYLS